MRTSRRCPKHRRNVARAPGYNWLSRTEVDRGGTSCLGVGRCRKVGQENWESLVSFLFVACGIL